MKNIHLFAADLGASNGRTIYGRFDGERLRLKELNRFSNAYINWNGEYYWDALMLYGNVLNGLTEFAGRIKEPLSGIGIDTWGVDFVLMDRDGRMMSNPYSYRDPHGKRGMDLFCKKYGTQAGFDATGISNYEFNTLFQLYDMSVHHHPALEQADKLLMLPDFFGYGLSGELSTEYTNATTTQIFDCSKGVWSGDILNKLGVQRDLFTHIQQAGEVKGKMRSGVAKKLGLSNLPNIICVGSHDTASAVASVPAMGKSFAFISSGTWSLIGVASKDVVKNNAIFQVGMSNEGTVDGQFTLMRNLMGMWLIQNCKKAWQLEGIQLSWDDIVTAAVAAPTYGTVIDINDDIFYDGAQPIQSICQYCRDTEQYVPETIGEIARCIYESMALCYREAISQIEEATGQKTEVLHIVGGGSQNRLLNQFTASALGREVISGPVEATTIGNLMVQLQSLGELKTPEDKLDILRKSFQIGSWFPQDETKWLAHYEKFLKVKGAYQRKKEERAKGDFK